MINHYHRKQQTSIIENAYKQQFRMLILRELLLKVTSIPHSNVIKTMVQRESQHWVSRYWKVNLEDVSINVIVKLVSMNDGSLRKHIHRYTFKWNSEWSLCDFLNNLGNTSLMQKYNTLWKLKLVTGYCHRKFLIKNKYFKFKQIGEITMPLKWVFKV